MPATVSELANPAAAPGPAQDATGEGLPNVVVIGAQKCGTSALHSYLARHPDASMSQPKELNFFIAEANWDKGLDWYRGQFDPGAKVRGESSPNYTADPRFAGVPERMARLIPDAKLIFMVRDPIDRIRAGWIHTYSNRAQHKPLNRAVLEDPDYVGRSLYHHQLSRFLEHYPMERILVLEQEELLDDREETLRRVFRFVGVRDDFWHNSYTRKRHETGKRRRKTRLGAAAEKRLSPKRWRRIRYRWPFSTEFEHADFDESVRAELVDRLRDDIQRFREVTGREFAGWSV